MSEEEEKAELEADNGVNDEADDIDFDAFLEEEEEKEKAVDETPKAAAKSDGNVLGTTTLPDNTTPDPDAEEGDGEQVELEAMVNEEIREFLHHYFLDLSGYVLREEAVLKKHELKSPGLNYIELREFIVTAVNNMTDIDRNIMHGLLKKLRDDVMQLYGIYDEFKRRTKNPNLIFVRDVLPTIKIYNKLQEELDDLNTKIALFDRLAKKAEAEMKEIDSIKKKSDEDIKNYKKLKGQSVDAVHHLMETRDEHKAKSETLEALKHMLHEAFFDAFETTRDKLIASTENVLNTKSYLLDSTLWYYAEKSRQVQNFFETANVHGDFSLRTFLDYYLKKVNMEKSLNPERINHLRKVLIMLKKE